MREKEEMFRSGQQIFSRERIKDKGWDYLYYI
jgi:hypothetical protein